MWPQPDGCGGWSADYILKTLTDIEYICFWLEENFENENVQFTVRLLMAQVSLQMICQSMTQFFILVE